MALTYVGDPRVAIRSGDPRWRWGRSSAGRAPALQAGGHRFDPGRLQDVGTSSRCPATGSCRDVCCGTTGSVRVVHHLRRGMGDVCRGVPAFGRVVFGSGSVRFGRVWSLSCESGSGAPLGVALDAVSDRHASSIRVSGWGRLHSWLVQRRWRRRVVRDGDVVLRVCAS